MSGARHAAGCRRRQQGLSLVELLVAITIGAILLSGAVSLFVSNKVTYQVTSDLSRLQENARFALDMMLRDIRMAGYFGCANDMAKLSDQTGLSDGSLWDTGDKPNAVAMEGIDDAGGSPPGDKWSPSGRAISTTGTGGTSDVIAAGTDAITIRYAKARSYKVDDGTPNLIGIDTGEDISLLKADTVAVVSDCGAADVFIIKTNSTSPNQLEPKLPLSRAYEKATEPAVSEFYAVRYYVAANGVLDNGDATKPHKSLYRERTNVGLVPENRELIDGVEDMQLLYGLDQNNDGTPNVYVEAGSSSLDDPSEWRSVVTVRIALLLRTVEPYGRVPDKKTYELLGPPGKPLYRAFGPYNDNRQRRLFITTAVVRNLQE